MIYPDLDAFTLVYSADGKTNDHSFLFDGKQWHLFHIWLQKSHDDVIGHATSDDLRTWRREADVLPKGPGPSWESAPTANAPYVYEWQGKYYLYFSRYSGHKHKDFNPLFNDTYQQIGVATGDDLFTWKKYEGNPVFHPDTSWCPWGDEGSDQCRPHMCRDPHVMRIGDQFVLYYISSTRKLNYSAIGHAVSPDLIHWQDRGPVLEMPLIWRGTSTCESPGVVHHNGLWWLFFKYGRGTCYCVSDTPYQFSHPARLVPTHASEVFQVGNQWLISHVDCNAGKFYLAEIDLNFNPPLIKRWQPEQTGEVSEVPVQKP